MNELGTPASELLAEVLRSGAIRSVFQPIIALDSGRVVAYEALARGPQGPLATPDALFAAARDAGRLAELDGACRSAAFHGAVAHSLVAPLTVFVNVEPEVLDSAPLDVLLEIAEQAPGRLRVVMEITERALAARPAELLRTVERVREVGWGIALDDVGAQAASLAFMPILRPDVVKLDLRLVQERPGPAVAEIMNAVNAYAERTGALILAEGIEDETHLRFARALGATLGQGWLFGRPAAGAAAQLVVDELVLPTPIVGPAGGMDASPFACLPANVLLRRSAKTLLIEVSKQLEREAMRLGPTCVVAATFQEARHFTASTAQRYRDLVDRVGFVCALGEGLPAEPLPGLRGATITVGDPIRGEWDLVVLSPHFSAALLARDLGDGGPEADRMFDYALTYDRDTVIRAASALLARIAPTVSTVVADQPASTVPAEQAERVAPAERAPSEVLLQRALAATTSGVAIADMQRPDQPLVYVNDAFEALSGFGRQQILGRNCRSLQGPDTDPAAVTRIRAAIAAGRECRETLLNYRGPHREPWWNEILLSPVVDSDGVVTQYIGVQNDVTARLNAERQLREERDRSNNYLVRIEQLAFTDHLTGLLNRRRVEERIESALLDIGVNGGALALLFIDLDGFKAVNDHLGHAGGDELLTITAQRIQTQLRRSDLVCRLGGDEFLAVILGLDPDTAEDEARAVAKKLVAKVSSPSAINGKAVTVGASIGISIGPADATEFGPLLHLADQRMYVIKNAANPRPRRE